MGRLSILQASLLIGLVACGGASADGTGASGTTTATSGTGATTSSGTTTGTGGGQGNTVTLTMDSFTVDPGAEVYWCQNFSNPFGGVDAEVSEFESHMSLGSHHLLLFYKDGATDAPKETCSGLEFAATPYGSQQPDDSLGFPPGVAALVPGSTGLRLQAHYLNTTSSTITAHVEITFHLAAPGTVQNQAGVLFAIDPSINVPPLSSAVVSDDCTVPTDMNVLRTSSHMHRHGTNFVATMAGSTVYQTTTWSDPVPEVFDTPMVFHQGDPLHFACTFVNNDPSATLTFGESALTNEMCIFTASFYPAPAGQATTAPKNCTTSQQ